MGNEKKYHITWILQNASLYISDTYCKWKQCIVVTIKNKRDNFFLQYDDNGVVEVWLCAFLSLALNGSGHLHTSATEGLHDSTGTLEAMKKTKVSAHDRHLCSGTRVIQPAAYHYAG